MALRIRRGTNSQRTSVTLDIGEIAYTTDTKKLYIGDGITSGGVNVLATSAGVGLQWNNSTQSLDYVGGPGTGISEIVQDTTPQLGGDLDLNGYSITGAGSVNVTGTLASSLGLGANLSLNGHNITGTGGIDVTGLVDVSSGLYHLTIEGNTLTGSGASNQVRLRNATTINGPAVFNSFTYPKTTFEAHAGTNLSPIVITNNTIMGGLTFSGYNGSSYVFSSVLVARVNDTGITTSTTHINSDLFIGNGAEIVGQTGKYLTVESNGTVSAAVLKTGSYASGSEPTPAVGMIIFDTTTHKFKGYSDDADGLGNPGWVDLN